MKYKKLPLFFINFIFLFCSVKCQSFFTSPQKTETPVRAYEECKSPRLQVPASFIEVHEGDLATLRCEIQGYPFPEVIWSKINTKINLTEHRFQQQYINNSAVLHIIGVRRQDAGTYTCVVSNNVGTPVNATIKLQVTDPVPLKPSIIKIYNSNIIFDLHTTGVIHCYAVGWPLPIIKWWRDGKYIENGTKYTLLPDEFSLKINSLIFNDNGLYQCHVFENNKQSSYIAQDNRVIINYCEQNITCTEWLMKATNTTKSSPKLKIKCVDNNLIDTLKTTSDLKNLADSLLHDSIHTDTYPSLSHFGRMLFQIQNITLPSMQEKRIDHQTTSSILDSMSKILTNMDLSTTVKGTASVVTPQSAILVTDTARSYVIGILTLTKADNTSLSDMRPLFEGQEDKDEGEANLMVRLRGKLSDSRAAFVVHGSDRLFTQVGSSQAVVDSNIVSVLLSGQKDNSISADVEIKPWNPDKPHTCAYWDLEAGEWSTEGCRLIRHDDKTGRDVCHCTHGAHFGLLLGVEGNSRVLNVVSITGCSLSIAGLVVIAVTAIVFAQWREQLGNKILLHLSLSIALIITAFLVAIFVVETDRVSCIILGVLLHYSVLATFCWMLVTAVLQFYRLSVIFSSRTNHLLLKGALFAWGFPLLPIIILMLTAGPNCYVSENSSFCYPQDLDLILGVILPLIVVITPNLAIFLIIIYNITCGRDTKMTINSKDKRLLLSQFKKFIFLFFLLGLTWIFGLLAAAGMQRSETKLLFLSLFCIFAPLQGFILFLYFILGDGMARKLWIKVFNKR